MNKALVFHNILIFTQKEFLVKINYRSTCIIHKLYKIFDDQLIFYFIMKGRKNGAGQRFVWYIILPCMSWAL